MARITSRRELFAQRRVAQQLARDARTAFLVTNGTDLVATYHATPENWYQPRPDEFHHRTLGHSFDEVVADLLASFADPDGLDRLDLSIWRDGHLLAVIRYGCGGVPEVVRFGC